MREDSAEHKRGKSVDNVLGMARRTLKLVDNRGWQVADRALL